MSYSFTVSTLLAFAYFFNTCFLLASTFELPGETTPKRIEIGIGSNANITCRMNLEFFDGEDSRSLYFIEDDTKNRVPQSEIAILNASTAVFMLRNAAEQSRSYTCMSGKNGIAVTHVDVGSPPLDVESFKCRAHDFKDMVCNFTIPPNKIHTRYNLTYYMTDPFYQTVTLPNGTNDRRVIFPLQRFIKTCEIDRYGGYALCNMTRDNGRYNQYRKFYNFTLTGSNALGTKRQSFWINHFENVVPAEPVLQFLEAKNDSAKLTWRMAHDLYKHKTRYDVRLRPDKFEWIIMNPFADYNITRSGSNYFLHLHNLPYAYYNYTVSFRLRVKSANDDEDLWSKANQIRIITSACLPDAPPHTDVGSFHLIDSTEPRVRLYWVQRPFYRENGANFQYVITQVRRDAFAIDDMSPLHLDRTSATFHWDREHQYEFVIKSRNDIGDSLESSQIIVPAMATKRIADFSPDWIRNIYHDRNRTYTLSWDPPNGQMDELEDYTVFWCLSKLAITNECNGTIQFTHLNKHITNYTTESQKQDQTLNLAVSANFRNFTTGMHWTMCAADISSNLMQMEPQIKQITAREIDVQWNLEKICTSLLEGYNLTYCPVESIELGVCLYGSERTLKVEKNAKNYVINELQPHTAYKIEMFMYSGMRVGKTSEARIIKTNEAAPSEPRYLRYSNITSNSVLLNWLPPIESNGIIKSYTIVYYTLGENNEHHEILCDSGADENLCKSSEITYKLPLLRSYTNYAVYILAHTIEASNRSNEIMFTTLVGIPSSPQHLKTSETNGTILEWTQPNFTSDRVDFYEVSIERWYNGIKKEEHVYGVIGSTSCRINIPACLDKMQKHVIRVTAVTAASRANETDLQLLNQISGDETNRPMTTQYYTESGQLQCVNADMDLEMQLLQWQSYHNSKEFILYRSNGENGITYGCAPAREDYFILIYIIAVGIGVVIGAVFVKCSYDKFQKMRNISVILPHMLANPPKDNNNGFVGGYSHEPNDVFYMRSSKESSQTEHRRLLISADSGYLGGAAGSGNDVSAIGVSTPPISMGRSSAYDDGNAEEPNGDYCNTNFTAAQLTENGKLVRSPLPSPSPPPAYTIMQVRSPLVAENEDYNGGYVPPSGFVSTPAAKPYTTMSPQPSLPFIPSTNCYVKPNQIFNAPTQQSPLTASSNLQPAYGSAISHSSAMPNISSSGYVQRPASFLQKPPTPAYVSYTTVDALNKHENTTTAMPFQTPAPPPSGYVTHKELSALGQHRFS